MRLDALTAGVLGLGANGGAYFAEIFRAGFESIPKGQVEAARMLGLTPWQVLTRVKLPQMLVLITPPSVNQVIIAWMRQSKPSVLAIIAGSKIDQLKENIAALDLVLSDEQMQTLNTAGDPVIRQAWLQPT